MTGDVRSRSSGMWLAAAAVCAAAGIMCLWGWFWPGAIPSGTTSGVWTALARDDANGILYRPLRESGYYGGTRYMPLFFVLHSLGISAGWDPVRAGIALSFAAVALFDAGLYRLLRQSGLRIWSALAWAALAHASVSYQLVTLEFRSDVLAAALGLWGLSFARADGGPGRWLACACFTAAFAAKLSALAGPAAVLLWHLRRREWGIAAFYAAVTGSAMLAVAWFTNAQSDGRMLTSFLACAGGGGGIGYAIRAPGWFLLTLAQDPFLLGIVGFSAYQAWVGRAVFGWPAAFLAASAAVALPVFASAGTGSNHLLELLAAALLALGDAWSRADQAGLRWRVFLGALAGAQVLSWMTPIPTVRSVIERAGRPERAAVERINGRLRGDPRPVLSENPLLPILMGQRPAVLDAYSLRLLAERDPGIAAEFRRRVEGREFAAVILLDWSGAPAADIESAIASHGSFGLGAFYGGVHFPAGFLGELKRGYSLGFVDRPYVVFLPRPADDRR